MPSGEEQLVADLKKQASRSPKDLAAMQYFFKTGKGQYAEGDVFIGVSMPRIREVCKDYRDLSVNQLENLLESPLHEVRMASLIIMTNQSVSKRVDEATKTAIFKLYLRRTDRINNWDLVDVSCRDIVGGYLVDRPRDILYKLAKSDDIWEKRIAMVSTWYFIRLNDLEDTFKIADLLLGDKHDLIHKAVGWMLREAGKKDRPALLGFLDKYASVMPRTTLRYSIEHLSQAEKTHYMKQKAVNA